MLEYKIHRMVLGAVSTNCYILYREDAKRAIIFDPADRADLILAKVEELGVRLEAICLTHGHFDHILAVNELKEKLNIKVYAQEEEVSIAADGMKNLSQWNGESYTVKVDVPLKDGETIDLAGFSMQVLHTPGHTCGSCCYYLAEEKLLFSGDTLFAGSVGRSDFPTGSGSLLLRSLREKIAPLLEDTNVYPGHGEQTDIGYEKHNNPFFV